MSRTKILFLLTLLFLSSCTPSPSSQPSAIPASPVPTTAANADVVFVEAIQQADGSWTFSVTVAHPDTGWEDYSDGWDIVLPDGTVVKPDPEAAFTRVLTHPHVDEQPFTRSQSGIEIPPETLSVLVRAHDLLDGFGGQQIPVRLDQDAGLGFSVQRLENSVVPFTPVPGYPASGLDGNHYLPASLDLQSARSLNIPLNGQPLWVVGIASEEGILTLMVALADGKLDHITITDGQPEVISLSAALSAGMPPALSLEKGIFNFQAERLAPDTYPILTTSGSLAFVTNEGNVRLVKDESFLEIPLAALPDARLLSDGDGQLLVLTDPTLQYAHGVLGDALEASSVSLLTEGGVVLASFPVPAHLVIEGLFPLWVDFNLDGEREIILTLSDADRGARLAIFSPSGELLAESDPIGTGFRWRHLLAAAPFGPKGQIELVDVLTPHLGGVVTFYRLEGNSLAPVASMPGYTSHVIGTRNLDMALAADFDLDSQAELLIPNQARSELSLLQRTPDGIEVMASFPLQGKVSTNLVGIPISGNSLAVAVGLDTGLLQVWLP